MRLSASRVSASARVLEAPSRCDCFPARDTERRCDRRADDVGGAVRPAVLNPGPLPHRRTRRLGRMQSRDHCGRQPASAGQGQAFSVSRRIPGNPAESCRQPGHRLTSAAGNTIVSSLAGSADRRLPSGSPEGKFIEEALKVAARSGRYWIITLLYLRLPRRRVCGLFHSRQPLMLRAGSVFLGDGAGFSAARRPVPPPGPSVRRLFRAPRREDFVLAAVMMPQRAGG